MKNLKSDWHFKKKEIEKIVSFSNESDLESNKFKWEFAKLKSFVNKDVRTANEISLSNPQNIQILNELIQAIKQKWNLEWQDIFKLWYEEIKKALWDALDQDWNIIPNKFKWKDWVFVIQSFLFISWKSSLKWKDIKIDWLVWVNTLYAILNRQKLSENYKSIWWKPDGIINSLALKAMLKEVSIWEAKPKQTTETKQKIDKSNSVFVDSTSVGKWTTKPQYPSQTKELTDKWWSKEISQIPSQEKPILDKEDTETILPQEELIEEAKTEQKPDFKQTFAIDREQWIAPDFEDFAEQEYTAFMDDKGKLTYITKWKDDLSIETFSLSKEVINNLEKNFQNSYIISISAEIMASHFNNKSKQVWMPQYRNADEDYLNKSKKIIEMAQALVKDPTSMTDQKIEEILQEMFGEDCEYQNPEYSVGIEPSLLKDIFKMILTSNKDLKTKKYEILQFFRSNYGEINIVSQMTEEEALKSDQLKDVNNILSNEELLSYFINTDFEIVSEKNLLEKNYSQMIVEAGITKKQFLDIVKEITKLKRNLAEVSVENKKQVIENMHKIGKEWSNQEIWRNYLDTQSKVWIELLLRWWIIKYIIENTPNIRNKDKFIDLYGDIQWVWFWDMSDQDKKDYSEAITWWLLWTALTLPLWWVGAFIWWSAWRFGWALLTMGRLWLTSNIVRWSTQMIGAWIGFYEWSQITSNILQWNEWSYWLGDTEWMTKSVLLFTILWVGSKYWEWFLKKVFAKTEMSQFMRWASQKLMEWWILWAGSNIIEETIFDNEVEWKWSDLLQAVLLTMILWPTLQKSQKFIATKIEWKVALKIKMKNEKIEANKDLGRYIDDIESIINSWIIDEINVLNDFWVKYKNATGKLCPQRMEDLLKNHILAIKNGDNINIEKTKNLLKNNFIIKEKTASKKETKKDDSLNLSQKIFLKIKTLLEWFKESRERKKYENHLLNNFLAEYKVEFSKEFPKNRITELKNAVKEYVFAEKTWNEVKINEWMTKINNILTVVESEYMTFPKDEIIKTVNKDLKRRKDDWNINMDIKMNLSWLNPDLIKKFEIYWIKESQITGNINKLIEILDQKISPEARQWDKKLLDLGGEYERVSFLLLSDINAKLWWWTKYVVVNDLFYNAIKPLQEYYREVKFIRADDISILNKINPIIE